MSNNIYVSPRLYSSNYKTKKLKSNFDMGIGYAVPDNMSKSEFKRIYAQWEKKLRESGFEDLEYRGLNGQCSPYFKRNGSTATFQALYSPETEEYYSLARAFEAFMNEAPRGKKRSRWCKYFSGNSLTYRLLWHLHIEGVPYRAVAAAFGGRKTHWIRNCQPIPKRLRHPRSVFWAHTHTHKILNLFWAWAKRKGLADPRSGKGTTYEQVELENDRTQSCKR